MLLKSEWTDYESELCNSDQLNSESGDLVQQCSPSEEMLVSSMYLTIYMAK